MEGHATDLRNYWSNVKENENKLAGDEVKIIPPQNTHVNIQVGLLFDEGANKRWKSKIKKAKRYFCSHSSSPLPLKSTVTEGIFCSM